MQNRMSRFQHAAAGPFKRTPLPVVMVRPVPPSHHLPAPTIKGEACLTPSLVLPVPIRIAPLPTSERTIKRFVTTL